MTDDISECEMWIFSVAAVRERRMKSGWIWRENWPRLDFFEDIGNVRADGDEALSVMRDAQISKVNDGRSDGVPQRMKTSTEHIEDVFGLSMFVADDGVFHSFYIFKDKPTRPEFFHDLNTRNHQTVPLVHSRTFTCSDGSTDSSGAV